MEKPKKPELTKLQIERKENELSAHISDNDIEKYENYLGFDLSSWRGETVLDIGSGRNEKFAKRALELGVKVVSMAPHFRFGELVKGEDSPEGRAVGGRAQEMPFPDNTFNKEVAMTSVPYYLPYSEEEYSYFFKEALRTLKPKGELYVYPVFEGGRIGEFVSKEIISKILDGLAESSYRLEKIPETLDKTGREYRLIVAKKG